jgi:AP-3 complex subunit beta
LFPNVVTKVVVKNLQVKKLVYTYLMQYAEFKPDEALLSVNNFQKDLSDKNQFIRALALRVLSGIRVGEIAQVFFFLFLTF